MNKVVFYVMTEKGFLVLNHAISINVDLIAFVVIGKDRSLKKDYSKEIIKLSKENNLDYFFKGEEPQINQEDYVFAISWRWMIDHLTDKLIVFHDSLLPKYRGFAPLINMLINGEKEIGVSAIFGSVDYDRGDLIAQQKIKINYPIKISNAIKQNNENYLKLVEVLINKILNGEKIEGVPQNNLQATYSIWRDFNDFNIDWNQSSDYIKRFIDALDYPYSGATCTTSNGIKLRVKNADIVKDVKCELRHVGKVIFMKEGKPTIICGKGLLSITEAYEIINGLEINYIPMKLFKVKFT